MEEDVENQAWDGEDVEDVATGRQAPASGRQAPIRPQKSAKPPPSPWTWKCGFRVPEPTSKTKTGQYEV